MKFFLVLFALGASLVPTFADECSSIANVDKVDCVPNDPQWTVASCLAKGCCHAEVSGYPACFINHARAHEARCTRVAINARRDCGNDHTNEASCHSHGCCWEPVQGAPYCYQPDTTIPDTHTVPPEAVPQGEQCTRVAVNVRRDCGNDHTQEAECHNHGCCWEPVPGAPYCYHPDASNPDTHTNPPDTHTSPPDTHTQPPDTNPGPPIDQSRWKGRGAKVAFVEVEAEHAHHTGRVLDHDRTYGQLSSEASGRRAVQLNAVGQYVEFTMPIKANSIVVRYSLPDSADGKGLDATLDLLIDGTKLKELPVTSRYSWFYGSYPFTNHPNEPNPHHFYDETRTLLDKEYPAGTKLRLQVNSLQHSPTFTIDLADFELVGAPHPAPANSLSVVTYGADPTSKTDSTSAFQKAANDGKAQKKIVYIPQGHYTLYDHVTVDQVTIAGAGPWYSVLGGRHPTDRKKAIGIFGTEFANDGKGSHNVHLKDFAIIGDITERDDSAVTNAIGGSLTDSTVDNVWLQHVKVGVWLEGKMSNFVLKNSRILDTPADGVNFHKGVTNSSVENTFVRNTGDDGLAMWADSIPEVNNKFIHNTVGIPVLANCIAIYGGRDIEVSDNLVYDTVTNGGGIQIANRFSNVKGETAVHGNFKLYRNTALRAGATDTLWKHGIGAIWFDGWNEDIHANVHVKDCDIIDSSYAAISFVEGKVFGVVVENVFINGTGTYAVQIQTDGEATFKDVQAHNVRQAVPYYNCNSAFKMTVQGSRTGWYVDKPDCRDIHAVVPKWPWNW